MRRKWDDTVNFLDGMKSAQPISIDDVFKTNLVGGTLVRASPRPESEEIEYHPEVPVPRLIVYTKGTIRTLKRENGKLRIETDNEDLRLVVAEAKARFYPRADGGVSIHPGWNDCVVSYSLYAPGPLPERIAREFR